MDLISSMIERTQDQLGIRRFPNAPRQFKENLEKLKFKTNSIESDKKDCDPDPNNPQEVKVSVYQTEQDKTYNNRSC
jgi:hypothetical protein